MKEMTRIEIVEDAADEIVEIAEGCGKNFAWMLGRLVKESVESGEYSIYELGVLIERVAKTYVGLNAWRESKGYAEV